jgi:hypothetical protein
MTPYLASLHGGLNSFIKECIAGKQDNLLIYQSRLFEWQPRYFDTFVGK